MQRDAPAVESPAASTTTGTSTTSGSSSTEAKCPVDDALGEAVDALEKVPWYDVDGVSATTAATFAEQLREAQDEHDGSDSP